MSAVPGESMDEMTVLPSGLAVAIVPKVMNHVRYLSVEKGRLTLSKYEQKR